MKRVSLGSNPMDSVLVFNACFTCMYHGDVYGFLRKKNDSQFSNNRSPLCVKNSYQTGVFIVLHQLVWMAPTL